MKAILALYVKSVKKYHRLDQKNHSCPYQMSLPQDQGGLCFKSFHISDYSGHDIDIFLTIFTYSARIAIFVMFSFVSELICVNLSLFYWKNESEVMKVFVIGFLKPWQIEILPPLSQSMIVQVCRTT